MNFREKLNRVDPEFAVEEPLLTVSTPDATP